MIELGKEKSLVEKIKLDKTKDATKKPTLDELTIRVNLLIDLVIELQKQINR